MRRILVIGSGGAGKTTFSLALSEAMGIPVVHLDTLYWKPGWVASESDEWRQIVSAEIQKSEWIMDGNYGSTLERRCEAADAIIFLDTPRLVCLWRLILRRIRYRGVSRPSMTPNCPERISFEFLWWVATYGWRRRPGILALLDRCRVTKQVFIFRTKIDVDRFLEELGSSAS